MPSYSGKSYKKIGTSKIDERLLHRIKAEDVLGHELPTGAVIHHSNGGKEGPIVICESSGYHSLLHVRTKAYVATGNPNARKCPFCRRWDDPQNMSLRKNKFSGFYYHSICDNDYRRSLRKKLMEPGSEQ